MASLRALLTAMAARSATCEATATVLFLRRGNQRMRRQELLAAIKARLNEVYGARLKGLVLFGSFARGRARPDSDIDILALLDGPLDYGHELRAIVDALYDLQLLTAHPLEVLPADSEEYAKREWPLYRAAAADGKAL